MNTFNVHMKVESRGPAEDDLEITKQVQAPDEVEALVLARSLVRTENTEINASKIWAWAIEREL